MLNAFAHTTVVQNTAVDLGGAGQCGHLHSQQAQGRALVGFQGTFRNAKFEMPT